MKTNADIHQDNLRKIMIRLDKNDPFHYWEYQYLRKHGVAISGDLLLRIKEKFNEKQIKQYERKFEVTQKWKKFI